MKTILNLLLLLVTFLSGCSVSSPDAVVLPTIALEQSLPTSAPFRSQAIATDAVVTLEAVPSAAPSLAPSLVPSLVPSPSPTTPALVSDCLVGAWEVTNLPAAMSESLAQTQATLALEAVNGKVLYEFAQDGQMRITFNELSAELNGTMEGRDVSIEQSLNGSGTAHYAVDALSEQLALSNFGGEGIQTTLTINGQVIAENLLPVWEAFRNGQVISEGDASAVELNSETIAISRADASCVGDSLTLQAVDPATGPPVTLERVD